MPGRLIARLQPFIPLLRRGLAIGLSLGALYLALRQVSFAEALAELQAAFARTDGFWVLLALGSVAVNILSKVLRWRVLCAGPGRAIPFRRYLGVLLAGQALNWLYPARLGDVLRAQAIGEQGPGMAFVLGTLVTEKAFDTLAYALLFVFLAFTLPLPIWLNVSVSGLVTLALLLAFTLGALALRGHDLLPVLARLSAWLPVGVRRWGLARGQAALASLGVLRDRRLAWGLLGLTALSWLTAVLNNQLTFRAAHLDLPLLAAALLLAALQAGVVLPAVPGSVGVFEYACVLVLGLWGVAQGTAFAYGVLLHVLVMLPSLILGLAYLGRWGWSPRRMM